VVAKGETPDERQDAEKTFAAFENGQSRHWVEFISFFFFFFCFFFFVCSSVSVVFSLCSVREMVDLANLDSQHTNLAL
jgi:hypothetical protein